VGRASRRELELQNAAGLTVYRAPASPGAFTHPTAFVLEAERLFPGIYTQFVAKVKGEAEASLVVRIDSST
jgi:hypothetical protein